MFVLNAPYNGGTHLPDITVVAPVFDDQGEHVLFYTAARGHHADIGGITPGSMPAHSKNVDEEGVLIDNFKLVSKGRFREQEIEAVLRNAQFPARNCEQNIADLKAQVAACKKGILELNQMIGHFGLEVVSAYMQHVQDNAEESVRRVIDRLENGALSNRRWMTAQKLLSKLRWIIKTAVQQSTLRARQNNRTQTSMRRRPLQRLRCFMYFVA